MITVPEKGSIWRERRRAYRARTVEVLGCTGQGGHVTIKTLTTTEGDAPKRGITTHVRLDLWYKTFELIGNGRGWGTEVGR